MKKLILGLLGLLAICLISICLIPSCHKLNEGVVIDKRYEGRDNDIATVVIKGVYKGDTLIEKRQYYIYLNTYYQCKVGDKIKLD